MKSTLYPNKSRTHALALRDDLFYDGSRSRIDRGMSNPKKDKTAKRARKGHLDGHTRESKGILAKTHYAKSLGIVTRFVKEMGLSGNRSQRRYEAKRAMALIRRPNFENSEKPCGYTARGLKSV